MVYGGLNLLAPCSGMARLRYTVMPLCRVARLSAGLVCGLERLVLAMSSSSTNMIRGSINPRKYQTHVPWLQAEGKHPSLLVLQLSLRARNCR